MIELLILYFGSVLLYLLVKRTPATRFDTVVTATWTASLVTIWLPLLDYPNRSIGGHAATLTVLSHLAVLLGFRLVTRNGGTSIRNVTKTADLQIIGGRHALPVAGILFVAFNFGLRFSRGQIPLLTPLTNAKSLRTAHWAGESIGLADNLLVQTQYIALPLVTLLPLWIQRRDRYRTAVAMLGAVCIADVGFEDGGRANIALMMIGVGATVLSVFHLTPKQKAAATGVAVATVYTLGIVFVQARNPDFEDNPDFFLAHTCDAVYDPMVKDSSVDWQSLAFSSCYFATPMLNLSDFIEESEFSGNERWGTYTLGRVFQTEFSQTREEIARFWASRRYGQNPWATSVRDFWIDFGDLAPLAFFAFGGAVGMLTTNRPKSDLHLARNSLLVPWAFMTPFLSPLIIPILIYPVLITIVIELGVKLAGPSSTSGGGRAHNRTSTAKRSNYPTDEPKHLTSHESARTGI